MQNPSKPTAVRIPKPTNPDGSPLTIRLNKRMAELGLCSRREADAWIEQGWVRVNGQPAVVGQPVAVNARIEIDRAAEQQQKQQVTILINKPVGYVSGQAGARPRNWSKPQRMRLLHSDQRLPGWTSPTAGSCPSSAWPLT